MRDGWREVRLGEILKEIRRPVLVADLKEVRYAGVRWYGEGVYPRDTVPAAQVRAKELTELRAGDITYNRMWATKASFGVAHADVDGCHVTNDFPIFAVDEREVGKNYLEVTFDNPSFQGEAAARATGTTERRRLKQRDFLQIPIALPPLAEQRRIVDLIAAVDYAIDAAEGETTAGKGLLNDVLDATDSDSSKSLGIVASISSGASWGKADLRGSVEDGGSPVLTIANTKPDGTVNGAPTYVAGLSVGVQRLTDSSIVAIRTNGNHDRIGNVYRVPDSYLGAAVSAFQLVIEPTEPSDTAFIYWMMRRPRFQSWVTAAASGSTGLGNIAASKLREAVVPWPDSDERARLVRRFGDIAGAVDAARCTANALRMLRSNLLTVLLSGAHEIPSSYDRLLKEGVVA